MGIHLKGHDRIISRSQDDRRHPDLAQERTGTALFIVISRAPKTPNGPGKLVIEMDQAMGKWMHMIVDQPGYPPPTDRQVLLDRPDEIVIVNPVAVELQVGAAPGQVHWW